MIDIYTVLQGSGKTRHLKKEIKRLIAKEGKTVITNIAPYDTLPLDYDIKKGDGKYIYSPNEKLTPKWLVKYAEENHVQGREGQSYIIIDDASKMFDIKHNPEYEDEEWIWFFMRIKYHAYYMIIAELSDLHVNKLIRQFLEKEYYHSKLLIMGKNIYCASAYWRATGEPVGKQYIVL